MGVVVLDVCPRCNTDISRRLGLITKRVITCPNCGLEMNVNENAVINNWQFNGAVIGFLGIWLVLAATFLISADAAQKVGKDFGIVAKGFKGQALASASKPAGTAEASAICGGFGRLAGWLVAQNMAAELQQMADEADRLVQLQRSGAPVETWRDAPRPPAPPGPFSLVLRMFFFLLWTVLFFFIALCVMTFVATQGIPIEEKDAREKAVEEMSKKAAGYVCLGPFVLAAILAFFRLLPGTRKPRPSSAEPFDPLA